MLCAKGQSNNLLGKQRPPATARHEGGMEVQGASPEEYTTAKAEQEARNTARLLNHWATSVSRHHQIPFEITNPSSRAVVGTGLQAPRSM